MTILVTGANGFVGASVCAKLTGTGFAVRPVVRTMSPAAISTDLLPPFFANFEGDTDWTSALNGVTSIIHLAARVHVMNDTVEDSLAAYRQVNVIGTLNLARQAAAAGVRRFVFISTIKVNGELTTEGRPFKADDKPAPMDAYGRSKAEAEAQLIQLARETGMEVTIIRSPLIYGPGVNGNLAMLISCVKHGLPLPLGSVTQNRRSLVGVDNLVDLICVCIDHPKAANQIFLISDGEDLSTAALLIMIGEALGRPARLINIPLNAVSFLFGLLGKEAISQRLLGSLEVDILKTCELLSWKPPVAASLGLRKAVEQVKC